MLSELKSYLITLKSHAKEEKIMCNIYSWQETCIENIHKTTHHK